VLFTAIEVYFSTDSILAIEGGNAIFRVTSGSTNVPITVRVETFDFIPPDAQGLVYNNLFHLHTLLLYYSWFGLSATDNKCHIKSVCGVTNIDN